MKNYEGAWVCHSTKQAEQILQVFHFPLFGLVHPINSILPTDTNIFSWNWGTDQLLSYTAELQLCYLDQEVFV